MNFQKECHQNSHEFSRPLYNAPCQEVSNETQRTAKDKAREKAPSRKLLDPPRRVGLSPSGVQRMGVWTEIGLFQHFTPFVKFYGTRSLLCLRPDQAIGFSWQRLGYFSVPIAIGMGKPPESTSTKIFMLYALVWQNVLWWLVATKLFLV